MNGNTAPAIYDAPVATRPANAGAALVAVEQERAIAEVQAAIILAKKFPRNPIEAMDRIMTACQRPGLAEQAVYEYARGGSAISGPSIRLAEAIAQSWGNVQFGIRELEQRNGESTVEAFAWDVESNTRHVKTFQVKHERYTKKGSYRLEDPRDIYEMTANQGARRLRAAILAIIPGDVVDAAVNECEATLKAKADTSPEALKKLVDAFAVLKVTKEQIEKRIQRHIDAITPAQIVNLKKVYLSIRDGMSAPADWFEPATEAATESEKQDKAATLKDKIKKNAAKEKDVPQSAEVPDDLAPGPCPDKPETTYTAAYCSTCAKRGGCPAWN